MGDVAIHVGEVSIHVGEVSIHVGDVSIHMGDVSIHVGYVSIHMGDVSIHVRHTWAPISTSRTTNPPSFHSELNHLFMNLKLKHLFVFFSTRLPPDYLSFLTDH